MKKVFLLLAIALPIVFNSCKDDKDEPIPDNHEYVDLGLPSGTLWATCNVGADSPEEYGDYFAWGETTPKDSYLWNNYKWSGSGSSNWLDALTKYWVDENGGILDGKRELEPEDDAATVNWGPRWCMPTLGQLQELLVECEWQWVEQKGVSGHLLTGPNGKTLFLPSAGGFSTTPYNDGVCCYYWSRTLCSPDKLILEAAGSREAYILFANSWRKEVWYDSRYVGLPVRAVRVSRK